MFYNNDLKILYYPIHKNGQTTLFTNIKFKKINYTIPHLKKICIVRNPFDRCLSSFLHIRKNFKNEYQPDFIRYLSEKTFNNISQNDIHYGFKCYLNEIHKNGHFDRHSYSQKYFLKNCDLSECIFIDLKNVDNYFYNNFGIKLQKYNVQDIKINRLKLIQDNYEKIKKLYQEDIDFIQDLNVV